MKKNLLFWDTATKLFVNMLIWGLAVIKPDMSRVSPVNWHRGQVREAAERVILVYLCSILSKAKTHAEGLGTSFIKHGLL